VCPRRCVAAFAARGKAALRAKARGEGCGLPRAKACRGPRGEAALRARGKARAAKPRAACGKAASCRGKAAY